MAHFNLESCKITVAKVHRDFGLQDTNHYYDCVEWIGEALELIGSGAQLERFKTTIDITGFKAPLPKGIVQIQSVTKDGKILPLKSSTTDIETDENWYSVNRDYIITGFETGQVVFIFTGFPVDEDGFPLVPANQYFREALFWYCVMKLILLGRKSPAGLGYGDAEQRWLKYCSAARNKANFPSIDQYEQFRRSWVSLIPRDRYEEGFNDNVVRKNEVVNPSALGIQNSMLTDYDGNPLLDYNNIPLTE